MTPTVRGPVRRIRARQLARRVAAATGAPSAQVDEHYDLTAIVVQRPTSAHETHTLVVELIHDRHNPEHRWLATATDELRQTQTPLSHGHTAKAAIAGINWSTLDAPS
jgi:hypothetical protein